MITPLTRWVVAQSSFGCFCLMYLWRPRIFSVLLSEGPAGHGFFASRLPGFLPTSAVFVLGHVDGWRPRLFWFSDTWMGGGRGCCVPRLGGRPAAADLCNFGEAGGRLLGLI